MVLPLLFSFLAPQLLGGTALGATLGTAGTAALGAGLGGFAETGDIEKGLMTGLGAFAGGQLLGPLMGKGGGALAEPLPGQVTVGQGANAMTALAPGNPGIVGLPTSELLPPSATGMAGVSPAAMNAAAGTPGTLAPTPAQAPAGGGMFGNLKGALGDAMAFAKTPVGMGSGLGALAGQAVGDAMFGGGDDDGDKKKSPAKTEAKAIPRMKTTPGSDYRPGKSGEFDYGVSTPQSAEDILKYSRTGVMPYAGGGMLSRFANPNVPGLGPVRLADGGIVELAGGAQDAPNEREVISAAVSAVKGRHPNPEIALGAFLAMYGEGALRALVDKVQSGEMDDTAERFANGENGAVRGPGDGSGTDDMVPARMDDGSGDVLLSDGEYVLRKDAVDSLEKMYGGGVLDAINDAGPDAARAAQQHMAAA